MKTTMEQIVGIKNTPVIYRNLSYEEIFEHEKKKGETTLTSQGAMTVDTGIFTGRSPKDKFLVKEPSSENNVWWGKINQPCSAEIFETLHKRVVEYLAGKELYVFDGFAGARKSTRMSLRVVTERAWQHHFCTNMFIRPTDAELQNFDPEFTIINASGLKNPDWKEHGLNSEVFVLFHLGKKIAIIGGTEYGGEMKKGIFSVMNYYKPLEGILTMHCSANVGKDRGDSALFFGLSGTGKTTLSTDPKRPLIGDDEHGWDDEGIWNLEGGCYAKAINLNPDDEPLIYNAIKRDALLENVVVRDDSTVDYSSSQKTENTRVSYPIFHIPNRIESGVAGHPENIIFLTCDAFGVLPPVARLTPEQAMYHFLSGYTAKVAGTERGVTEPTATFSACFGAAFMTLHPTKYARLLGEKMRKHNTKAYLVNTGWAGGPYGVGQRMKIKLTRSIIDGIFDGTLDHGKYTHHDVLNLDIPDEMGSVETSLLHPWESWKSRDDYEAQAKKLAGMFIENFKQYVSDSHEFDFTSHGPKLS
ncbi:MAG: phosphoenolpyruvate carboxykinase (ATP) [Spirochaetales bacterium]|nr:phosphoenolpyruvate carboxykinase (ATP) [Leptospiraceae bacterium]MCP5480793.1 phosphoenolpyruvate carboxykinase (ATP) [Spirochaetales bacterium]